MSMEPMVRRYRKGDEKGILELFKAVFNRDMSRSYWNWRFRYGPSGHALIHIADYEGQIVGHHALAPVDFFISGQPCKALLSVTIMIHPEFRGPRNFFRLCLKAYADALSSGFGFIYGFPNRNAYAVFKRVGWHGYGNKREWVLDLHGDLPYSIPVSLHEVERFGSEAAKIWHAYPKGGYTGVSRITPYLNWRFVYNPISEYRKFIVRGEDGSPISYLVLKEYESTEGRVGHIIDFSPVEWSILQSIIAESASIFREGGISRMTAWIPECITDDHMNAMGLRSEDRPETYFGFRELDAGVSDILKVKSNWFVTMGDSDVF